MKINLYFLSVLQVQLGQVETKISYRLGIRKFTLYYTPFCVCSCSACLYDDGIVFLYTHS